MGNHDVGRSMSAAADVFWIANGTDEVTKDKALAALDASAKRYIGADAEFDDELSEETSLSRLVAVAFDATPEEIADRDHATHEGELWYAGPVTRFRQYFRFC